jgi:DNA-binding IclR family transcriptional regulator
MPLNRAITILKSMAHDHTRFITMEDLCKALDMPPEQCHEILGQCEAMGLVRRTKSAKGEPFIWLAPKLGDN